MSIRTQLRASVAAPSVGQVPLKTWTPRRSQQMASEMCCDVSFTHTTADVLMQQPMTRLAMKDIPVSDLCRVEFCQKKPFKSLCLQDMPVCNTDLLSCIT